MEDRETQWGISSVILVAHHVSLRVVLNPRLWRIRLIGLRVIKKHAH